MQYTIQLLGKAVDVDGVDGEDGAVVVEGHWSVPLVVPGDALALLSAAVDLPAVFLEVATTEVLEEVRVDAGERFDADVAESEDVVGADVASAQQRVCGVVDAVGGRVDWLGEPVAALAWQQVGGGGGVVSGEGAEAGGGGAAEDLLAQAGDDDVRQPPGNRGHRRGHRVRGRGVHRPLPRTFRHRCGRRATRADAPAAAHRLPEVLLVGKTLQPRPQVLAPVPVQLVRESLASCHFRTLCTTETWLRPSRTPSPAVGRESVPHREMTLTADVPFGPRRREPYEVSQNW